MTLVPQAIQGSAPGSGGSPRGRLQSVDALRGFAMVLVILQHSYLNVDRRAVPSLLDILIWPVTGLAAVAFVSIAGAVLTYALLSRPNWRSVYRHSAVRGAALLLIVHPTINVASYYFRMARHDATSNFHSIAGRLFLDFPITDMIGVCLLLTPAFIVRSGSKARFMLIATALTATPFIVAFLTPSDPRASILKEAVFGVAGEPTLFWFPLAPWIAIFLSGSFLGQALARLKQGALDISLLVNQLRRAGAFLLVTSFTLTLAYKLAKLACAESCSPDLFRALYPRQTTTLLPGYFGLLAWLLASFMARIDIQGRYDRHAWLLSIFGRTSLFTYVLQYVVIGSVPALLGLTGSLGLQGFLALFVLGLVSLWLLAYGYGRLRGIFRPDDYATGLLAARMDRAMAPL